MLDWKDLDESMLSGVEQWMNNNDLKPGKDYRATYNSDDMSQSPLLFTKSGLEKLEQGRAHNEHIIATLEKKLQEIKTEDKANGTTLLFQARAKAPNAIKEKVFKALISECKERSQTQRQLDFNDVFLTIQKDASASKPGFNEKEFKSVTSGPFYKETKQLLDKLRKGGTPPKDKDRSGKRFAS